MPSLPASIAATSIGSDKIKVVWKAPVSANGIIKEYRLDTNRTRLLYKTPSWCQFKGDSPRASTTLPANKLFVEIDKLFPYAEYSVSVSAASGVGFGEEAQMTIVTAPAGEFSIFSSPWIVGIIINGKTFVTAPEVVSQPQVTSTSTLSYTITWGQPCQTNGKLKSFDVSVHGTRENYDYNDVLDISINANLSVRFFIFHLEKEKISHE